MKKTLLCILFCLAAGTVRGDPAALLQMIDYMGVDYPNAVNQGRVINADEYAEMQEFAGHIETGIGQLHPSKQTPKLTSLAKQLHAAVDAKSDPAAITDITRQLRRGLMQSPDLVLTPRQPPDLQQGKALYTQHCASCHGLDARGDGPAAASLDPPPIDFHDAQRARQRSLYGLYNTITLGVSGTSMTGFSQLSDGQRWDLAFYVGSRYLDPATLEKDAGDWAAHPIPLKEAVTQSPEELAARYPQGGAASAWLRAHPEVLFAGSSGPVAVSLHNLARSLAAYRSGNTKKAEKLALSAYLDGFELAEAPLSNVAPGLVGEIEAAMSAYRGGIRERISTRELQSRYDRAVALLHEAHEALSGESLSPSVAFTSSLIILLREGLEAILVLAAMMTFLLKTGRNEAMRYLHAGWITALLAGIVTWWLSSYLITITGSTRETTEGATALFASAILLYVGYWMHGNINAQKWSRYLRHKMDEALGGSTFWAIFLLAFLAVYREIFETILFYQALWVQASAGAHSVIVYGAALAALLLAALVWLMARFGLRIPLKQFFTVSAVLMVVLAVIFAGQGIAALQEAGKIPSYPIPIPRIELLGIFPDAQSTTLQALIILFAVGVALHQRRRTGV